MNHNTSAASPAGFWLRFFAVLIDGTLIVALKKALAVFVIAPLLGKTLETLLQETITPLLGVLAMTLISSVTVVFFILIVIGWLYCSLMESSALQATLGKMVFGLQVTDLDGHRLTWMRASARHFAKILSFLTFFLGYLLAAFTSKKQALHDMLAGCLVVKYDEALPLPRWLAIPAALIFAVTMDKVFDLNEKTIPALSIPSIPSIPSLPSTAAVETEVKGTIAGHPFTGNYAVLQGDILHIQERNPTVPDQEITVFLFLKGAPAAGKTYDVEASEQFDKPHVHLRWKDPETLKSQSKAYMNLYRMRLKFGQVHGDKITGTISLRMPEEASTEVSGPFEALIR